MINHDISLWDIPKTLIWAFGGQTKQTMAGIEVVYDILEQVGSVQQAQK